MNGRAGAGDDEPTQADHRDVIADFLDGDNNDADGNDAGGDSPTGEPAEQGDNPATPGEPAEDKNDENENEDAPAHTRRRVQLPGADPARRGINWLANLPTPGGIVLMISVLLFFLFAFVPMGPNGETRLYLIWRGLTGGAKVPADTTTAQTEQDQKAQDEAAWQGFWEGAAAPIITDLQP
jgi:hypothetical protein